jgi:hypothetical protein
MTESVFVANSDFVPYDILYPGAEPTQGGQADPGPLAPRA